MDPCLDALSYLFSYFDRSSLLTARLVCRQWNQVASSDWIKHWQTSYEDMVAITAQDYTQSPVKHKGGTYGQTCTTSDTTCTIRKHLVYRKIRMVPEKKRVSHGYFQAIIRELQHAGVLYERLRKERANVYHERGRVVHGRGRRHGNTTKEERDIYQKYTGLIKHINEKIERLGVVMKQDCLAQTTARIETLQRHADMICRAKN